jgi:pyruvate formate lyase activating enzyme
MDSNLHKELTGVPNEIILSNLKFICGFMKDHLYPKELWLRTPLIPGATADEIIIGEIGNFISGLMSDKITRWDLCAFNNLCRDKYERLGIDWKYKKTEQLRRPDIDQLYKAAEDTLNNKSILKWSGPLRIEEPLSLDEVKIGKSIKNKLC